MQRGKEKVGARTGDAMILVAFCFVLFTHTAGFGGARAQGAGSTERSEQPEGGRPKRSRDGITETRRRGERKAARALSPPLCLSRTCRQSQLVPPSLKDQLPPSFVFYRF